MDRNRRFIVWITILCLIQDYGFCSEILEGPKNVTVLSGSTASFMCTVGTGWEVISWYLQTYFIVNIYPTGTTVSRNHTIIVQNSTNAITGAFTSAITIVNVNKTNSGLVRCSSLSASFQDAYLTVQVNGSVQITNGSVIVKPKSNVTMICQAAQWSPAPTITWQINNTAADVLYYSTTYTTAANDFVTAISTFKISPEEDLSLTCLASIPTLTQPQAATAIIAVREHIPGSGSSLSQTDIILIAVFGSLGGLLLLALIIALIVYCCRKQKKKKEERGYQSDAWKTRENSNNLKAMDRDSLGEHNFAYTPEPVLVRQNFGSIHASNTAYDDKTSTSTASSSQVPAQKWTDNRPKTIRHVTHV
ncbi:immunoglobulin superfamily member 5 isoform 1-T4 [Anomaloglossus baeobatrachus]|uniref:immunoglobulin superfamily member 5 n=1 Tax=Anomaloglossus baeobatrachus TaxID=238106 RepID=UPI003F5004AC